MGITARAWRGIGSRVAGRGRAGSPEVVPTAAPTTAPTAAPTAGGDVRPRPARPWLAATRHVGVATSFLGLTSPVVHDGIVARTTARKPRRPAVSPEEENLFLEAIAGTAPLAGRDRVRLPPERTRIAPEPVLPPRRRLAVEVTDGQLSARADGVNRAQVAALRGGKVRVEDTLDLHGETVATALPRLQRFLLDAARHHRRCVLVVHGKGLHGDGTAVLRDAVRGALAGELSGLVHAFATAGPADGGDGATCVLVVSP